MNTYADYADVKQSNQIKPTYYIDTQTCLLYLIPQCLLETNKTKPIHLLTFAEKMQTKTYTNKEAVPS